MNRYEIPYRPAAPALDPRAESAWADVPAGAIDCFPWYRSGRKQSTAFRAVWSEAGLFLRFDCQDGHISASATRINDQVCGDSCVEVFVAPNPAKPLNYYNFEMNCVGTYLMGTHCDWAEGYRDHSLDVGLSVATTVPGPTKTDSPADAGWSLVARIPWAHFDHDAPHLPPRPGDLWRANFYRCGGQTDPQLACWSPVDLPNPAFHAPRFFGELLFVA
jgi:hypothetical protein